MNLSHLNDQSLLDKTAELAKEERKILTAMLHHLKEIERRRLFSSLGYSSLFDYTVKSLGFSADQAYRRISAMRLLKELPQIEEKISSGRMTLTNLNLAQSLFKQEKKSTRLDISSSEKIKILEKLENKSSREAQKIVFSLSSEPQKIIPEKIRPLSEDLTEFKFTASKELEEKIVKLKGLLAHSHPNTTMAELVNLLCDLGLKKFDPMQKESVQQVGKKMESKIKKLKTTECKTKKPKCKAPKNQKSKTIKNLTIDSVQEKLPTTVKIKSHRINSESYIQEKFSIESRLDQSVLDNQNSNQQNQFFPENESSNHINMFSNSNKHKPLWAIKVDFDINENGFEKLEVIKNVCNPVTKNVGDNLFIYAGNMGGNPTGSLELLQNIKKETALKTDISTGGKQVERDLTNKRRQVSRYIPVNIKQAVWQRDQGQCQQCGSHHAIQFDHIKPVAFKGAATIDNIRLLCRSCNLRAAVLSFGQGKMDQYLSQALDPGT